MNDTYYADYVRTMRTMTPRTDAVETLHTARLNNPHTPSPWEADSNPFTLARKLERERTVLLDALKEARAALEHEQPYTVGLAMYLKRTIELMRK